MAFKYQWDETSLRMFLHIDIVRRLFPEFEFQEPDEEAIAERRARGIGTRPSYLVQVMQSAGSVYVEGKLDTQIAAPAKLVQSTSAADLSIPIETFIPTAALSAIEQSRLAILLLHADSVAANKLIVQRLGSLCSVPVHDALCYGIFLYLAFKIKTQHRGTSAIWPKTRCCNCWASPIRCTQRKSCGAIGNHAKGSWPKSIN